VALSARGLSVPRNCALPPPQLLLQYLLLPLAAARTSSAAACGPHHGMIIMLLVVVMVLVVALVVVVVMLQVLMAAGVEDNAPTAVAARAILHERLVRSHACRGRHADRYGGGECAHGCWR
jgi:uncharacterized membrane protein